MPKSKIISTSVSPELAEQIDQVAKLESQSRASVIRAAIEVMTALPVKALSNIFDLHQQGTAEDREILYNDIARAFLHHQYRLGQRALAKTIDQKFLDTLETEEDIINAAIALTKKSV